MRKLIIPLYLIILYACGNGGNTDSSESKQYRVEGEYIVLPEDSPIIRNMEMERARFSDHRSTFTVSGTVKAIPANYAEVAAPFSGRIVKSFVRLGQKVSAGSPIFEINSPDFFETSKTFFQAKQEMELALKNLNRERDLFENRVGVAKDLEEAEANYELCRQEYENSRAAVGVYQIDVDKMIPGQPLVVKSPIAGKVVKSDIVIGQYIKDDAEPLAIVADLNKVWVVAHVKEKDIPMLHDIEEVEISLTTMPDARINGTLHYVGELLDETTRSIEVIIECDNPGHDMKPFMYGTVHFYNTVARTIILPSTAVMQEQYSDYVLIEESKGKFIRRKVETESVDINSVRVVSGISEGESVVVKGGIYLNM